MSRITDALGDLPEFTSTWDGSVVQGDPTKSRICWDGDAVDPDTGLASASSFTEVQWDGRIGYRPYSPEGRAINFRPQSADEQRYDPRLPDLRTVRGPIVGLVATNQSDLPTVDTMVKGVVLEVGWDVIQPVQGGSVNASILAYWIGLARTSGMGVRFRVLAGTRAPTWAKTLNGFTPVSVGAAGTVGPFWTDDYLAAYQEVVDALVPIFRISSPVKEMSFTGTMVNPADQATTRLWTGADTNGLLSQGYTYTDDMSATSLWARTQRDSLAKVGVRSVLEVGPSERLDASGGVYGDWFAPELLSSWWSGLGKFSAVSAGKVRFAAPTTATGMAVPLVPNQDEEDLWRYVSAFQPSFTPVLLAQMLQGSNPTWASPFETAARCAVDFGATSFLLPAGSNQPEAGDMQITQEQADWLNDAMAANAGMA